MNKILSVSAIDVHGPKYKEEDVVKLTTELIKTYNYFHRRAKIMNEDAKNAISDVENYTKVLINSINKLIETEKKFSDENKKISGGVRDAMSKMADGITRIEKMANFDKLEKYADSLERIAHSMSVLYSFEKDGKLQSIIDSLK